VPENFAPYISETTRATPNFFAKTIALIILHNVSELEDNRVGDLRGIRHTKCQLPVLVEPEVVI
jgi:hypothetical protein